MSTTVDTQELPLLNAALRHVEVEDLRTLQQSMQAGTAALMFTVQVVIENGLWSVRRYQDIRGFIKECTVL